jgi:hypothetical protein
MIVAFLISFIIATPIAIIWVNLIDRANKDQKSKELSNDDNDDRIQIL